MPRLALFKYRVNLVKELQSTIDGGRLAVPNWGHTLHDKIPCGNC